MGILTRKKDAAEHVGSELSGYTIDYGDDPNTYVLRDSEGNIVRGNVAIGGLGVNEGLFTNKRRYKRLIGREVEKSLGEYKGGSKKGEPEKGSDKVKVETSTKKGSGDATIKPKPGGVSTTNTKVNTVVREPDAEEIKPTEIGTVISMIEDLSEQIKQPTLIPKTYDSTAEQEAKWARQRASNPYYSPEDEQLEFYDHSRRPASATDVVDSNNYQYVGKRIMKVPDHESAVRSVDEARSRGFTHFELPDGRLIPIRLDPWDPGYKGLQLSKASEKAEMRKKVDQARAAAQSTRSTLWQP